MSQQGQPVSVLLHTAAICYYATHRLITLITYWVSGLLPASHLLAQYILQSGFHHAIDTDRNTHFSGAVLKLISLPKSLQASHSIPHNTHILLPRRPPTFHAIINPDFCRGIFQTHTGAQYGSKGSRDGEKWGVFASARKL